MKLVREIGKDENYACKFIPKGTVIRHNTLYVPIKPDLLKREIIILRSLRGKHCCFLLEAIFETLKWLIRVTEYSRGGEMIRYVAIAKRISRRMMFQEFPFSCLMPSIIVRRMAW